MGQQEEIQKLSMWNVEVECLLLVERVCGAQNSSIPRAGTSSQRKPCRERTALLETPGPFSRSLTQIPIACYSFFTVPLPSCRLRAGLRVYTSSPVAHRDAPFGNEDQIPP